MLKMTKKSQKNLQDSKNSSIFAAGIEKGKSPVVFEKCSATPCEAWKPKEAMSIREMLVRTERGQRLDVHTRFRAEGIPDNMYYAEYEDIRLNDGTIEKRVKRDTLEDTFAHTPPDDVNDIVDVIRLAEETNQRKEDLKKRRSTKTVANAEELVPKPGEDRDKSPVSRETPKQPTKEESKE